MHVEWFITGVLAVSTFFYYARVLPLRWSKYSVKRFEKKLFWNTLALRIIWIFCYYAFTMLVWDTPWEQPIGTSMDSGGYFNTGMWVTDMIKNSSLHVYWNYGLQTGLSDLGYPFYLGIMNLFSGDSILFSRLFNAVFDAWSAILVYRLASRNFGETIGRMSAVFVMIMPLMFFYAGLTMKESLMGMLCLWFLERTDLMMRSRSFSLIQIFFVVLLIGLIFFFRSALAIVAVMSLLAALVFTSHRIIGWGRRILISFFILSIIAVFMGGYIMQQAEEIKQQSTIAGDVNLEFRANRKGGNELAKRLSAAVFAPVIFTVPFPTMVDIPGQPTQQLLNGANYIKNVMSFFCIAALVMLFRKGQWRKHALLIAFLCGYMAALGLSSFAHAGRFHQPAVPLELIFSAFAICNYNPKYKKYYIWFLCFIFVVVIAWTVFKLAGRGMI